MHTPIDASYLADAVILLRYFESKGEVRQATVDHQEKGERTRADHSRVSHEGRAVAGGGTMRDFRGVLTGTPVYEPDAGNATSEK